MAEHHTEHVASPGAVGWLTRLRPVLLILGIGLMVSVALFFALRRWEVRENQAEFDYAATHPVEAVRRATERINMVHEAMREYFYGDPNVTRNEFATSVAPFLPHVPALKNWLWAPRVSRADRDPFEETARREGFHDFRITESATPGNLVSANDRDDYFPIWYAVSPSGDPPRLGWDLASNEVIRSALVRCCDENCMVTTQQLPIAKHVGGGPVFLTLLPVYDDPQRATTVEERRHLLKGFLVGGCLAGELVENALQYDASPHGIDIRLFDRSAPTGHDSLYFHLSRTRPVGEAVQIAPATTRPSGIHYIGSIVFGTRDWSLVCTPAPGFFAAHIRWRSWTALGIGLFLTLLAGFYAWAAITRRERIERIVDRRTRQLRKRDEQLRLAQELKVKALRVAHEDTIERLVTASLCRDQETGMHIRRTGLFSELLAKAAGWSEADAEIIRLAAPMHDVGKIGIPDAILQKPGKLTPAEFETMKTHTLIGARMLEGSDSAILAMASQIALCHHERWNGSGYPNGLSGPEIPEAARILSIVDVYDALSHARVYHAAMSEKKVLTLMADAAATQFDPHLLAVFFAHFDDILRLAEENPDVPAVDTAPLPSSVRVGAPIASAGLEAASTFVSPSL